MTAPTSPSFLALVPRFVLGLALGTLTAPALADEEARPRRDRFGDPLPAGAIARLGTTRFRGNAHDVAYAAGGKSIVGASFCGPIYFWDAVSGKFLHRIRPQEFIGFMVVSPKGDKLAAGRAAVGLYDTATGKRLSYLSDGGQPVAANALAFAPDGNVLVTGGRAAADQIVAWDAATGKPLRTFQGKSGAIEFLAYAPDGKQLASWGADQIVRLWDAETGVERAPVTKQPGDVTALVFAGGGKLLVGAGKDQTIRVWDVAARKEVHRLAEKHGGVMSLAVSPDGRTLACGNEDGTLSLWEIDKGRELRHWPGDTFAISSIAFSPDGKSLLSGCPMRSCVRQWEVATGREIRVFGSHRNGISWLSFSPDGRQLYSAAHMENRVLRWDVRGGREQRWFSWPGGSLDGFLLAPDGKTAATQDQQWRGDGTIHLWDTASGKEQRVLDQGKIKPASSIMSHHAVFSPDGKLLADGNSEGVVVLWEVATGKERGRWQKLTRPISDLAFSPDGKRLAAATWRDAQRTLRYWDTATGNDLCSFDCRRSITGLAVAPDGRLVATGGDREEPIRLWDAATGKQIRALDDLGKQWYATLHSLAFSPDSRFLAVSRFDEESTIRVWEAATGAEVWHFAAPAAGLLRFAPDGRSLASGGTDSAILLWDLTSGRNRDGLQPAVLTAQQLATCWQELADADAGRAYRAAWLMASDMERAVPFLQRQWRASLIADDKKIARHIADLDSEQFTVRERALAELAKQGVAVLPALRRAVQGNPSLELRLRVQQIRTKLDGQLARLRRMAFVLEQRGDPAARQLLADIAARKLDDGLTQEVNAALQRLQRSKK